MQDTVYMHMVSIFISVILIVIVTKILPLNVLLNKVTNTTAFWVERGIRLKNKEITGKLLDIPYYKETRD